MKFNDKELGAWATVFAPDKEGLLEKKGAGRGQGESVTEAREAVRDAFSSYTQPFPRSLNNCMMESLAGHL